MNATPVVTEPDYAQVDWGPDGCPRSPQFDDVFHSTAGAVGQCEHVFVRGNQLYERWQQSPRFAIGELGFGSGLNFLVTASAWLEQATPGQSLHYCAVEKHPWRTADGEKLFSACKLNTTLRDEWLQQQSRLCVGSNRFVLAGGRIHLTLHIGDVAAVLPQMQGQVNAWYLDGFNPRSNSQMWNAQVFSQLYRLSAAGATLASWCCAGDVRRGLNAAGFDVDKAAGYAHKREMMRGQRPGPTTPRRQVRRVQVVGAGIAGAWLARELADRGISVEIYDRSHGPARGASGMPMLMIRPFARHRDTPTARFFWQAAPFAVERTAKLDLQSWVETPVWRSFGAEPAHWLQPAAWCDGRELGARLLEHPAIQAFWNRDIPSTEAWSCRLEPTILCTGLPKTQMLGNVRNVRPIRGQQTLWHGNQGQLGAHSPRVGDCVAAQADEGLYFGATHKPGDDNTVICAEEALEYGKKLPRPPTPDDLNQMTHWTGTRYQSRDRLPCCGPAPDWPRLDVHRHEAGRAILDDIPIQTDLWLNLAHGSRGATSAVLCAVMVADQLENLPAPVLDAEREALDPRRFILRDWRRGRLEAIQ